MSTPTAYISSGIAVVHIVWKPFGVQVFRRFIESYKANWPGTPHQLILLFKGFEREDDSREFAALLSRIEHKRLYIEDQGFDIGAYLHAVNVINTDYFCFLNSRSVLLCSDWLNKLYSFARLKSVGIVGATGSWESLYSDHVRDVGGRAAGTAWARHLVRRSVVNQLRHRYYYPPFPNYHIRTNAFMIRRDILGKLSIGNVRTRRDTSRFENGRVGITRQILKMRLHALVVGRDGRAYEHLQWPSSNTFWIGDQENLMVADNQTDFYRKAGDAERAALRLKAWGGGGVVGRRLE